MIIIFEVLEHLNNWKTFINKIKNNLNADGLLIISTINKNIFSKYIGIFLAEKILRWIPEGTHEYNKFIKPEDLIYNFNDTELVLNDLTGLIFDPIELKWKLSKIH